MYFLADTLSAGSLIFLILAVSLALIFEMVNGFHDTANAVVTVIYTRTLRPWVAVIWSGCWNLIGVLCSTGMVAFAILALLPANLVLHVGSAVSFAMVFAILISAILWNLGTWYFGLPASSSHTLIGSIIGVGLANSVIASTHAAVNWAKAYEVLLSLLISPIIGFVCAAVLLLIARFLIKQRDLYTAPPRDKAPPAWIRGILVLTCTGVSFAHGSNDGQKGIGLILLILIGILPGAYALNMKSDAAEISHLRTTALAVQHFPSPGTPGEDQGGGLPIATNSTDIATARQHLSDLLQSNSTNQDINSAINAISGQIAHELSDLHSFNDLSPDDRQSLRNDIYLLTQSISRLNAAKSASPLLLQYQSQLTNATQFIPTWVKFAVAISLGCGTMFGWKRIVKTIGEKLGKDHLTYAQGASAEIVAMATIGIASRFGLPVSTTHVLSSGIAGTMVANRSGVQMATVRNVLLAWVLTLPVCIFLGAALFAAGLFIVFNHLVAIAAALLGAFALIYAGWLLFSEFRRRALAAPTVQRILSY